MQNLHVPCRVLAALHNEFQLIVYAVILEMPGKNKILFGVFYSIENVIRQDIDIAVNIDAFLMLREKLMRMKLVPAVVPGVVKSIEGKRPDLPDAVIPESQQRRIVGKADIIIII